MSRTLLALTLLATSCASADDTATTTGTIAIAAEPEGAVGRGSNVFVVTVESKEPVTALEATAWMPSMGHGAPSDPRVVQTSATKFRVEEVVFSMPGAWELRLKATSAHGKGERVLKYEVP